MELDPKAYPSLTRLLAAEESEKKVVKNFRHKGQDFAILEKDRGPLRKKVYIFQLDGENFEPEGYAGWTSAQDALNAIKEMVRTQDKPNKLSSEVEAWSV